MLTRYWGIGSLSAVAAVILSACTPGSVERASHSGDLDGDAVQLAGASTANLPTGEIEAVCGLKPSALGTRVDRLPETGRVAYALYDTAPGSSAPRTFYVTGFGDGCPRRMTAALAMLGSVELYEMVRMTGLADAPQSDTDLAYARIRERPCGAEKTPCTGRGLRSLSRQTAFVTSFPRKASARHVEMLLHKGELVATAQK